MWSSCFLCELHWKLKFNHVLTLRFMQVVRGYSSRKSVSVGLGNSLLTKEPGVDLPLLSHLESEQTYYNIPCCVAASQHRLVLLLRP
jgi:hypothetical protein